MLKMTPQAMAIGANMSPAAIQAASNLAKCDIYDEWTREGVTLVRKYTLTRSFDDVFLGEDVRMWAEANYLIKTPHEKRKWGSVMVLAHTLKLIKKDVQEFGYTKAPTSNPSPVTRWRRV